ncbi:MAG: MFS transporter, partial [Anaerolineae bacterium]
MSQLGVSPARDRTTGLGTKTAAIAWVVAAVFYFYQYTLRSAPSVMIPQLSGAFSLSALGMASLVGLFYYGYSIFSLVAGASLDRLGPRKLLPIAAVVIGIGAMSFASGSRGIASAGRFLHGGGGA